MLEGIKAKGFQMLWAMICYIHSSIMCNPASAGAQQGMQGDAKPWGSMLQCQSLCCFQKRKPTCLLGFYSLFPMLSLPCSYYRLFVITDFGTSSGTKSPARIALILGGGNYLTEITKFGALVASTLPAKLVVLTARAESCAAVLLSRKPRLLSDSWASQDKTSVLLSKKLAAFFFFFPPSFLVQVL